MAVTMGMMMMMMVCIFFSEIQKGRKSKIKLQGLCNMSILPNWSVKYTT